DSTGEYNLPSDLRINRPSFHLAELESTSHYEINPLATGISRLRQPVLIGLSRTSVSQPTGHRTDRLNSSLTTATELRAEFSFPEIRDDQSGLADRPRVGPLLFHLAIFFIVSLAFATAGTCDKSVKRLLLNSIFRRHLATSFVPLAPASQHEFSFNSFSCLPASQFPARMSFFQTKCNVHNKMDKKYCCQQNQQHQKSLLLKSAGHVFLGTSKQSRVGVNCSDNHRLEELYPAGRSHVHLTDCHHGCCDLEQKNIECIEKAKRSTSDGTYSVTNNCQMCWTTHGSTPAHNPIFSLPSGFSWWDPGIFSLPSPSLQPFQHSYPPNSSHFAPSIPNTYSNCPLQLFSFQKSAQTDQVRIDQWSKESSNKCDNDINLGKSEDSYGNTITTQAATTYCRRSPSFHHDVMVSTSPAPRLPISNTPLPSTPIAGDIATAPTFFNQNESRLLDGFTNSKAARKAESRGQTCFGMHTS
ncbi:unnamed protein product, partial [Protopolystoma xenopodis]